MNFTTHHSQTRTLKQSDPRFHIHDKFTVTPRAGFEISQQCPREYRLIIAECISNGWLKPVAHVTERELLFMGLAND
jgi:hypothetical protein